MLIFVEICDGCGGGAAGKAEATTKQNRRGAENAENGKSDGDYGKPARIGPKLVRGLTDDSLWSRLCLCSQTLKFIALFWSTCRPAYTWWIASKRFSSGAMEQKTSRGIWDRTWLDIFAWIFFRHRRKRAKTEFASWVARWRACCGTAGGRSRK